MICASVCLTSFPLPFASNNAEPRSAAQKDKSRVLPSANDRITHRIHGCAKLAPSSDGNFRCELSVEDVRDILIRRAGMWKGGNNLRTQNIRLRTTSRCTFSDILVDHLILPATIHSPNHCAVLKDQVAIGIVIGAADWQAVALNTSLSVASNRAFPLKFA